MSTPQDWWRTFFSGAMAAFWLRATTDEQTRQEADFIAQTLQAPPPARLLDVPCGGGRHCLDLAARGYQMTGGDLSSDFLAAARTAAAARSLTVQWEQREMGQLPWQGDFDGAFCFGNSFGYDQDEGNADFVKAVARALKPGGRFVLDVGYVTEILLPSLQERAWYALGDMLVLADRSARLYGYRELVQLFREAGFGDVEGFASLTREPFKLGSRRLLLVGRKVGK